MFIGMYCVGQTIIIIIINISKITISLVTEFGLGVFEYRTSSVHMSVVCQRLTLWELYFSLVSDVVSTFFPLSAYSYFAQGGPF